MNGMYVEAADTANTANEKIKKILAKADYVPQMNRSRYRSSSNVDGTYIKYGDYYYSSRATKLIDSTGNEYAGAGGICTWCAFTNLLNRRLAYDLGSKELFEANKFDILSVAKRIANTSDGVKFAGKEGERDYIWIGNQKSYADQYNKTFTNGNNRSYTGEIVSFASGTSVSDKKNTLKNALDNHPEGIVIQFYKNSSNMHGIVLTGYYTKDDGSLSFYTVDTAGTYGDGFTKIEDAYIGKNYGNNSSVDTIVQYTSYYVCLSSGSGSVVPPSPVDIFDLSIDGKISSIMLKAGQSANLMGKAAAGMVIKSINAVIKKSTGEIVYNKTINPNTTSVKIQDTALNKSVNNSTDYIKFGSLKEGSYTITVTAKDANNNTATKSLSFTVSNGITIDLSAFNGNLSYGKSYSIPGTITSTAKISKVYARVVNGQDQYQSTATYRKGHAKAGQRAECTVTGVNAYTYNIKGSKIDNAISMGGLNVGNYYFEVTVTDVNGNTKTARKAFTIR